MKHVVIGAGAAGITAARTIRSLRPEDEIVMIAKDRSVHSRCMLHKYISGERDADGLRFVPEDFFHTQNIRWMPDRSVENLARDQNRLTLDSGEIVTWDRLLIATGADSVIPPIGDLKTAVNAFGLRHLTDAQAIRDMAEGVRQVAVIGSGLVGLDAAYALLELGKQVTVIEMADTILSLNMDAHAAESYRQLFEAHGCMFHLGRKVCGTTGDRDGRILSLQLDDGQNVECEMVIVAAGVRPATGFLEGSGIETDRAVCIDDFLKTSREDVYAAGDAAGLSGIWPNAMKQGDIAARNMCGQQTRYADRFAVKNTVNFFDLLTLSVGATASAPGDRVLVEQDSRNYRKLIIRRGVVAGVLLQGNISNSGFWQYLIRNKIPISGIGKAPFRISYADFFGTEESGEYCWAI